MRAGAVRLLDEIGAKLDPDQRLGFLMLVRDITETRKMTEKKIESEKLTALTMLAAGVALLLVVLAVLFLMKIAH